MYTKIFEVIKYIRNRISERQDQVAFVPDQVQDPDIVLPEVPAISPPTPIPIPRIIPPPKHIDEIEDDGKPRKKKQSPRRVKK